MQWARLQRRVDLNLTPMNKIFVKMYSQQCQQYRVTRRKNILHNRRERSQSTVYIRGEPFAQGRRNRDNFRRSIPRRTLSSISRGSSVFARAARLPSERFTRFVWLKEKISRASRGTSRGDVFSFDYKHVGSQCINKPRARIHSVPS